MRIAILLLCHLFLSTLLSSAQELKLLSVSPTKLKTDSRPKKYFIQNKISSDTLLLSLNKNLIDHLQ